MKTLLRTLAVMILALLPRLASAGQAPGQLKLSIPAPPVGVQRVEYLGANVAVEGDNVVVGSSGDGTGAKYAGIVKVFDANTGALRLLLPNPDPLHFMYFGSSIGTSGTRIVVSAGDGNLKSRLRGRVYVFDLKSNVPTVPVATLDIPSPLQDEFQGLQVAISGSRVAVGVPSYGVGPAFAGRVFIHDLDAAQPSVPTFTLISPAAAGSVGFGFPVAISNDRVVVGVSLDSSDTETGGRAYVYDLSTENPTVPTLTLKNPDPGDDDIFAGRVAISGSRIVIGAIYHDFGASALGTVYVYDLNSLTPTFPVATLNNPTPARTDFFGDSVAISGTRVLIGSSYQHPGNVLTGQLFIYDLSSGTPTVPFAILDNPHPQDYDGFGNSIAIAGTKVIAGISLDFEGKVNAGTAYVYDLASNSPTVPSLELYHPGPSASDSFGYAVAVSGSLMVSGAPFEGTGAREAGSAYVYDLGSATPSVPLLTLNNPSPAAGDQFGNSVSISGQRVVVGAWKDKTGAKNTGSVYVYDLTTATPSVPIVTLHNPSPAANDYFGYSVAISGSKVVVGTPKDDTGATNAGRAYVFDLDSIQPTKPVARLNNPNPAKNDRFGWSVAIFGPRIVVGTPFADITAPDAGRAYVYNLESSTPTVPVIRIEDPRPLANDHFGHSVAISDTRVVVGVPNSDKRAVNSGGVYVYDLTDLRPMLPVAMLTNPSPAMNDNFGYSVAISGTRIVVGAYRDDTGVKDAGSVYLFDMNSTTPLLPAATLNKPNPSAIDRFGRSVAIGAGTIVVGTPEDDTTMFDKGAVYVFGR